MCRFVRVVGLPVGTGAVSGGPAAPSGRSLGRTVGRLCAWACGRAGAGAGGPAVWRLAVRRRGARHVDRQVRGPGCIFEVGWDLALRKVPHKAVPGLAVDGMRRKSWGRRRLSSVPLRCKSGACASFGIRTWVFQGAHLGPTRQPCSRRSSAGHPVHAVGARSWGSHSWHALSGRTARPLRTHPGHTQCGHSGCAWGTRSVCQVVEVGRSTPGVRLRASPQKEAPVARTFLEIRSLTEVFRRRALPRCMRRVHAPSVP